MMLTEYDKMFIRMLYDRRMVSGLPADKVREIARQILPEYYEVRP
jgi:hypothetical protein